MMPQGFFWVFFQHNEQTGETSVKLPEPIRLIVAKEFLCSDLTLRQGKGNRWFFSAPPALHSSYQAVGHQPAVPLSTAHFLLLPSSLPTGVWVCVHVQVVKGLAEKSPWSAIKRRHHGDTGAHLPLDASIERDTAHSDSHTHTHRWVWAQVVMGDSLWNSQIGGSDERWSGFGLKLGKIDLIHFDLDVSFKMSLDLHFFFF